MDLGSTSSHIVIVIMGFTALCVQCNPSALCILAHMMLADLSFTGRHVAIDTLGFTTVYVPCNPSAVYSHAHAIQTDLCSLAHTLLSVPRALPLCTYNVTRPLYTSWPTRCQRIFDSLAHTL